MHIGRSPCSLWMLLVVLCLASGVATPVWSQTLTALDDEYGIPFSEPLLVEMFGVMDNDLLDGEPAGENGATVSLVTDAALGTLNLAMDGSFTYTPGASFDGLDTFVYQVEFGAVTSVATVTLSACSGGPTLFDCWNENAFRTKLGELAFTTIEEGFESAAIWGGIRTPNTAASVSSQGIEWRSNHANPPALNPITTSSGAAHSGQWGIYDANHGYATGSSSQCDVDNPPEACLFYDGITGSREAGRSTLHGVGAYVHGIYGANVAILVNGGAPRGGGQLASGYVFFGTIDASPSGFTQFEFRELDGKIGQALYVWLDDFVIAVDAATDATNLQARQNGVILESATPNPMRSVAMLRFSLPPRATATLSIHDPRGRLVRQLVTGGHASGDGTLVWDGHDRRGNKVPSGIYFARLVAHHDGLEEVRMRKIVVTR